MVLSIIPRSTVCYTDLLNIVDLYKKMNSPSYNDLEFYEKFELNASFVLQGSAAILNLSSIIGSVCKVNPSVLIGLKAAELLVRLPNSILKGVHEGTNWLIENSSTWDFIEKGILSNLLSILSVIYQLENLQDYDWFSTPESINDPSITSALSGIIDSHLFFFKGSLYPLPHSLSPLFHHAPHHAPLLLHPELLNIVALATLALKPEGKPPKSTAQK
jgi:hypothetical protein